MEPNEEKKPWFKPQITFDSLISIGSIIIGLVGYAIATEHRFSVLEAFASNQAISNSVQDKQQSEFRQDVKERFDRFEQKLDKQWSLLQRR